MSREDDIELLRLLEEQDRRKKCRKLWSYYPDTGPLRRELYPKHMAFFEAGAKYRERLLMGGNRTGKTEGTGGCETTYHLTGQYPPWWNGRRFNRPIKAWAAGTTSKTTRDIIQFKLFGEKNEIGTGLIPGEFIHGKPTSKAGVPDAFDTALIKHKSGGYSQLVLKSFDQGRKAFEGNEVDVIWLDEEPPIEVYTECLIRTADTTGTDSHSGIIMLTFTPLEGMSETVLAFLPNGEIQERADNTKFVVMVGWDDVPHLTEETKAQLLASTPLYQRDARSKGIPQLGSGAIYPVPESEIVVPDFIIPDHWPRAYGMDVGWNRTAAPFGAWDRESDIVYLYSEHYRGQAEPSIHADSIKARGKWVPGVMDPAARGRSQDDGIQLIQKYKDLGLDIEVANNTVESGIYEVWQRLSTGRLKVFKSMTNWLSEYRLYRRDEKGRIVKQNDHIMDGTRYLIMSGLSRAKVKPFEKPKSGAGYYSGGGSSGWMG